MVSRNRKMTAPSQLSARRIMTPSIMAATFDALNIFDLTVHWNAARRTLHWSCPSAANSSPSTQSSLAGPDSRDCLPQPGIINPAQYLDFLSRQRPTWRLAYRNFKDHESLVTNQQVEALPGVAGVRWYEIRRDRQRYLFHLPTGHLRSRRWRPPLDGSGRTGQAGQHRFLVIAWLTGRPSFPASATLAAWRAIRLAR